MSSRPPSAFVFSPPEWLEETASTNDELRGRLRRGEAARPGMVVAARCQTRGKGRMGRSWHSAPGRDLTFSFLWAGASATECLGTFPMACALGVRDFLASPGLGIAARCKWPNDVMVGDAKICGILTEAPDAGDGLKRLVVGVGVNVGRNPGRDRAAGAAIASIEELSGIVSPPETLLPILLRFLERRIDAWTRSGLETIREEYSAAMWGIGRTVSARTGEGVVRGRVHGLGTGGELLLRLDEGTMVSVASASALDVPG